jgi:gluconokinase
MGVTGSGKTTIGHLLSESLGWKYLDADDFHTAANIEKMRRGIPLSDDDRGPWLLRLRELICECLETNQSAALSCSALKESYRKILLVDERVQLVYLKATPELIRDRITTRSGHYMNPALLESQFQTLEEPVDCFQVAASIPPEQIVTLIKRHFSLEVSSS